MKIKLRQKPNQIWLDRVPVNLRNAFKERCLAEDYTMARRFRYLFEWVVRDRYVPGLGKLSILSRRPLKYDNSVGTCAFNLRGVPETIHNRFKAWCAVRRLSMKKVIMKLMELDADGVLPWTMPSLEIKEGDNTREF